MNKYRIMTIGVAVFLLGSAVGYIVASQELGRADYYRAEERANEDLGCYRITLEARFTDKYCGDFWSYYFNVVAEDNK